MRIALSTLGTFGDIQPFARLARVLVARGHHVTVHAWPQYQAALELPGVTFVPSAADVSPAELNSTLAEALRETTPQGQIRRFMRLFYFEHADSYYRRVREALAGAELVVLNVLDHLGQAAAEELGVRWVGWRSRPIPAGARGAAEDALLVELDAELGQHIGRITARPPREVRVFRQRSPLLDLVGVSPALVTPAEAAPSDAVKESREALTGHFLEPPSAAPISAEIAAFLDAGRGPVLFATFGNLPDEGGRTAAIMEACRLVGVRAIVQSLRGVATSTPECLIVCDRLAYPALLARVDGILHHGGAGTTHEACRAGVPAFCVPYMGDQYFWAHILTERGLGPPLLPHVQAALRPLAARIHALLADPSYRVRAATAKAALAVEDGAAVATRLIEGLALRPTA